jgi:hypothetical protein
MLARREARPAIEDAYIDLRVLPLFCPTCLTGCTFDDDSIWVDHDAPSQLARMHQGRVPGQPMKAYSCPRCGFRLVNRNLPDIFFDGQLSVWTLN